MAYCLSHISTENFQNRLMHVTTISPPGCATSRPRPANQLQFLPYANAIYRMSPELSSVDKSDNNWLPWQRPSRDRKKTNFSLIIYSRGSINPANSATVGQADVEVTGVKAIVKK